uniref:Uncharacterized protein n=1 Tax=Alexandrium monilatum TaxID=311494 RepID=A0A7S4URT6_9DINO
MASVRAPVQAAVTVLYGESKFFNKVSVISDAIPTNVASLRRAQSLEVGGELGTIEPMLPAIFTALKAQRLTSTAMQPPFATLRDAVFAVCKRISFGTIKKLKHFHAAHGYMKHYSDEFDHMLRKKLRAELIGHVVENDWAPQADEVGDDLRVISDWKGLPPVGKLAIHSTFNEVAREGALRDRIRELRSSRLRADSDEANVVLFWRLRSSLVATRHDGPRVGTWGVTNGTRFRKDFFYDFVCDKIGGGSKDSRQKTVALLQGIVFAQGFAVSAVNLTGTAEREGKDE